MEQPPDPTRERDQRNEAISKVILAKDVTIMHMDKLAAQLGILFFFLRTFNFSLDCLDAVFRLLNTIILVLFLF